MKRRRPSLPRGASALILLFAPVICLPFQAFPSYPPCRWAELFLIEQPIAPPDRGTPRQLHSRRHAVVGSKPPEPTNETLLCARRASALRLFPIGGCSRRELPAH